VRSQDSSDERPPPGVGDRQPPSIRNAISAAMLAKEIATTVMSNHGMLVSSQPLETDLTRAVHCTQPRIFGNSHRPDDFNQIGSIVEDGWVYELKGDWTPPNVVV
jgi:hypothetical protein